MSSRTLAIVVGFGLLGLLALVGMQWSMRLGSFAVSPQQLILPLKARRIVGGGRARVGFRAYHDGVATLEADCAAEKQVLELTSHQLSEPVCGVRLRWLGVTAPQQVPGPELELALEVGWDD